MVHLISQLTQEGYRVATIKQTKKAITMDTAEKDTARHHGSGADLVVFSSSCETDFLLNKRMKISDIERKISEFGDFDFILVEGASDPDIPKIRVGNGNKRSNTIVSYKGNVKDILTLIRREVQKKSIRSRLSITVNGKDVPLTEFPEQIITTAIIGMIGSLKGVQNIRDIVIQLKQ